LSASPLISKRTIDLCGFFFNFAVWT